MPESQKNSVHSEIVDILSKVKDAQEEDIIISKTICYVKSGKKASLAQIQKIKSRPLCRYTCQLDQLVFCQGVLHSLCKQDGAKYHQLILPIESRVQVMELLHNEQGHQALDHILELV